MLQRVPHKCETVARKGASNHVAVAHIPDGIGVLPIEVNPAWVFLVGISKHVLIDSRVRKELGEVNLGVRDHRFIRIDCIRRLAKQLIAIKVDLGPRQLLLVGVDGSSPLPVLEKDRCQKCCLALFRVARGDEIGLERIVCRKVRTGVARCLRNIRQRSKVPHKALLCRIQEHRLESIEVPAACAVCQLVSLVEPKAIAERWPMVFIVIELDDYLAKIIHRAQISQGGSWGGTLDRQRVRIFANAALQLGVLEIRNKNQRREEREHECHRAEENSAEQPRRRGLPRGSERTLVAEDGFREQARQERPLGNPG